MARKKYNEKDNLRLLCENEVHLRGGMDAVSACRTAPSPTLFAIKIGNHVQPPA